jgi:hypothetical protein
MSRDTPADTVKLMRDAEEARATACGIASLVAPSTGLTRLQRVVLEALWR